MNLKDLYTATPVALTWSLWRLMETWGAMAACWLWGWGWWICRELGYD